MNLRHAAHLCDDDQIRERTKLARQTGARAALEWSRQRT